VRPFPTPDDGTSRLWYELGESYARAGEDIRKASFLGFVVSFVAAAEILLSAPLFGTSWAGPFAALIPAAAGLLSGGGSFWWRRARFSRRRAALSRAIAERGEDPERPTANGLGVYYDAQLVLLRSEYEYLRSRGTKRTLLSARLLESSFGFTPEDGFECGPLNVVPDTPRMRELRERWEARLSARRSLGEEAPPLGLREDAHHRIYPREMTVPAELAMRGAYLRISCKLVGERYGNKPKGLPEEVHRRAEKDLKEYAAVTGRRVR
jgi:hypothetical protein